MVALLIMDGYLEQSLTQLEVFEGSIPWMYRDTVGKVTVGVGAMLPDVAAAQLLPFRMGDRAATPEEIAEEFNRVNALPMGRAAHFYQRDGGLELEKAEIDALLLRVVTQFEGVLRERITGYDGFPDGVKMALIDMAYNLGPAGLLREYTRLIKAVESGNWAAAAGCCFRHGPGAARNQWTEKMFRQNVVGGLKAEGDGVLKHLGYGLVGLGASLLDWMKKRR